ncbi:hypothetical protein SteCoe_4808 [Stentor coeruleus]|uniref:Uncharacterized protein n=1 Tax=Stentor coeruleus TaxID=5963 RepID=A0A1R2CTW3_9CILI|nr:hypothetical protein SteCoe_4808 [Stentor coeruleus]
MSQSNRSRSRTPVNSSSSNSIVAQIKLSSLSESLNQELLSSENPLNKPLENAIILGTSIDEQTGKRRSKRISSSSLDQGSFKIPIPTTQSKKPVTSKSPQKGNTRKAPKKPFPKQDLNESLGKNSNVASGQTYKLTANSIKANGIKTARVTESHKNHDNQLVFSRSSLTRSSIKASNKIPANPIQDLSLESSGSLARPLEDLKKKIGDLERDLKKYKKCSLELQTAVTAKDNLIGKLQSDYKNSIMEKNIEIHELKKNLTDLEIKINDIVKDLDNKTKVETNYKKALQNKNDEIENLRNTLDLQKLTLGSILKNNAHLCEELTKSAEKYAIMENKFICDYDELKLKLDKIAIENKNLKDGMNKTNPSEVEDLKKSNKIHEEENRRLNELLKEKEIQIEKILCQGSDSRVVELGILVAALQAENSELQLKLKNL